ncbi:MAG: dGTP triphosphohydrolase [Pirellulaceae bacterium]
MIDDRWEWAERESKLLAPYAFSSLATRGRVHPEPLHPYRGPFTRDRDRILHSSAFRRLSGKMQVFTGDMGLYHRTRLTHTQEVASIARTLGRSLRLNEDLIEAMALLHDIGHPPFGHCGEDVLDEQMREVGGFSHNAFALALVQQLERRYPDFPGLNLSLETVDGPTQRADKHSPQAPLLEAQVVDAADSMTYDAHDVDDAWKLGLLDESALATQRLVRRALERGARPPQREADRRRFLVHSLIDLQVADFLQHNRPRMESIRSAQEAMDRNLRLELSPEIEVEKKLLERFLFEQVYRHPKLIAMRNRATDRLRQLFLLLENGPERLPVRFQKLAQEHSVTWAVGAYLAGMTDQFCDDQYLRMVEMGRRQAEDWE